MIDMLWGLTVVVALLAIIVGAFGFWSLREPGSTATVVFIGTVSAVLVIGGVVGTYHFVNGNSFEGQTFASIAIAFAALALLSR